LFYANAHTDIRRPIEDGVQFSIPLGALGKHLKRLSLGIPHDLEDSLNVVNWNVDRGNSLTIVLIGSTFAVLYPLILTVRVGIAAGVPSWSILKFNDSNSIRHVVD
jgi:hypothetical protein